MYFLPKYSRGIFNRYRKGMPWSEMFLKDLSVGVQMFIRTVLGKPQQTILTYPHFPSRGSTIYRISNKLGITVTNKLSRKGDLAIFWEYNTVRKDHSALENSDIKVINLFSRDISKDKVDIAMKQAFGYNTRLDPRLHNGQAVKKSLVNAVHDGQFIECPTEEEEGFIYQKYIDSSANENEVMDLRIPVMNGNIPHLYLNYRNKGERFKNVPDRAVLATNINDWLSVQEMDQIKLFCSISKLDFGELDVLRDVHDGRIYVVDVNNTPQGPPKKLPKEQKVIAIERLSQRFKSEFLNS